MGKSMGSSNGAGGWGEHGDGSFVPYGADADKAIAMPPKEKCGGGGAAVIVPDPHAERKAKPITVYLQPLPVHFITGSFTCPECSRPMAFEMRNGEFTHQTVVCAVGHVYSLEQ